MELKSSTISETWKLCTLGGFLGFFVLAVFLTSNPRTVLELSAARSSRSTVIAFFSPSSSSSPADNIQPIDTSSSSPATATVPVNTTRATANPAANTTSSTLFNSDGIHPTSHNSTANITLEAEPTSPTVTITRNTTDAASNITLPPSPAPVTSDASASALAVQKPPPLGENDWVAVAEEPTEKKRVRTCNMFEGRWVFNPEASPLYSVYQCPFLEDKMSCRRNGRPDTEYEGWIWEARDCDIPRFNGRDMLERLRGKRVIIAGDSLNRNQWESLACLIYISISPSRAFVDAEGSSYKVLKAKDYDFTLEFYWSPFLVFREVQHKKGRTRRVLHLDRMVPSSEQWRGADVMVFNSGHWWTHRRGKYQVWDVYQYEGETVEEMPIEVAYERALTTWSNWITENVDPNKTAVFFRSVSPEHKGKQWCFNATRPIPDDSYVNIFPRSLVEVAERKIAGVDDQLPPSFPFRYLNITWLSGYRRDAHPAMYRYKEWKWKVLTTKYMRLVAQQADCSHWCLPGLPDTWNRLLYASLFFSEKCGDDNSNSNNDSRIEEERKTGH